MSFTCYVIDDEQHAIDTITEYIRTATDWDLVGSSTLPQLALQEINELAPDFTFMDVDMPGLSGTDLAALVADKTAVIFTTAFAGYAIEAFENNISDYLLKPISLPRFLKAIKKAESHAKKTLAAEEAGLTSGYIFINPGVRGKVIKLAHEDITHIEGLKNYVMFFTPSEKHITYLTMAEVENALTADQFIRVHKSFIVNIRHIKSVDGQYITMLDGSHITLGGTYKDQLLAYIAKNTLRTGRK